MIIIDKKKYTVDIDEGEISNLGLSFNGTLKIRVNNRVAPLYRASIVDDGHGTLSLVLLACSHGESLSEGIEISIPSGECAKIEHLFKQVIREIPLDKESTSYERIF